MSPLERQIVLEGLTASETRLLELIGDLTPDQWRFREAPDRWSIAEILEHLVVFEDFIRQQIQKALTAPPRPEQESTAAKDPLALGLAESRNTKFKARESALPTGRWSSPADLIHEFRNTRARTLQFAARTDADLRGHFFPHIVFGDLDCCQWLIVLGTHTNRHALQIAEIKSHPGCVRVRHS
jgi:hypothetical protein